MASGPASSRAWPTPATLPCPKMPHIPATDRCRTPSRSVYCTDRKRTSACATVSLMRPRPPRAAARRPARPVQRQPLVREPALPGAPHPRVRRVVADQPGARRAGPRHHVEVVHVVAGYGHARPVPAVGDQHGVAGAHFGEHVGRAAGGGVDPLVADGGRAAAQLVVVDLLQPGLVRPLLVVLVRRVGRPVAAGGEHFDGDEPVAGEDVRGGEVVHLAAGAARAAQFDRYGGGGPVARGQPPGAAGTRQREPAAARDCAAPRGCHAARTRSRRRRRRRPAGRAA